MSEVFDLMFDCASIVIVVGNLMDTLRIGPIAAIAILIFWFFTRMVNAQNDNFFDAADTGNFDDYLRTGNAQGKINFDVTE